MINNFEYYEDGKSVCQLNDHINLVLVAKAKKNIIWDEVYLNFGKDFIYVGNIINDLASGFRSWIDFNDKCIIFYSGNERLRNYYIDKIYDIDKLEFVNMSAECVESKYNIDVYDNDHEDKLLLNR